eukprot:gene18957-22654_t
MLLIFVVVLAFYLLGETAEEYFCPVVRKLTTVLDLAPNTAGVTFLALGNGAPDVFASLAAFVNGDGKIGLGAIVSAGSFVTAFVVGSVAVAAAPFQVDIKPYLRDVLFYFVAACCVFAVCFTGTVHAYQSVLFVLYYIFYVIVVVVQDRLAFAKVLARAKSSPKGTRRSPSKLSPPSSLRGASTAQDVGAVLSTPEFFDNNWDADDDGPGQNGDPCMTRTPSLAAWLPAPSSP